MSPWLPSSSIRYYIGEDWRDAAKRIENQLQKKKNGHEHVKQMAFGGMHEIKGGGMKQNERTTQQQKKKNLLDLTDGARMYNIDEKNKKIHLHIWIAVCVCVCIEGI